MDHGSDQTHGEARVEGEIIHCRRMMLNGAMAFQAVVQDQDESVICVWHSDVKDTNNIVGKRYVFNGPIRQVDGKWLMIDPDFEPVTSASMSQDGTPAFAAPIMPTRQYAAVPQPAKTSLLAKISKVSRPSILIPAKLQPLIQHKYGKVGLAAVAILAVVGIVGASMGHSGSSAIQNTANLAAAAGQADGSSSNNSGSTTNLPIAPAAVANTPTDCDVKLLPFKTTTKNDPSLPSGQTKLAPQGINGQDKVCYPHGRNNGPVTTHLTPVDEAKYVGTGKAVSPARRSPPAIPSPSPAPPATP